MIKRHAGHRRKVADVAVHDAQEGADFFLVGRDAVEIAHRGSDHLLFDPQSRKSRSLSQLQIRFGMEPFTSHPSNHRTTLSYCHLGLYPSKSASCVAAPLWMQDYFVQQG